MNNKAFHQHGFPWWSLLIPAASVSPLATLVIAKISLSFWWSGAVLLFGILAFFALFMAAGSSLLTFRQRLLFPIPIFLLVSGYFLLPEFSYFYYGTRQAQILGLPNSFWFLIVISLALTVEQLAQDLRLRLPDRTRLFKGFRNVVVLVSASALLLSFPQPKVVAMGFTILTTGLLYCLGLCGYTAAESLKDGERDEQTTTFVEDQEALAL